MALDMIEPVVVAAYVERLLRVVAATSDSTRVSSKMRSAAPYSSTGSAKSATAPMKTSATAPAV